MKKVLLCGATHGSNFGDTIFAYMFYSYLNQTFPNVEFRFTEMSDHSKLYVSNKVADKEFISQASSLVYISGGYFGESHDEGFRGSVKRYMKYFNFGRKFVKKNKNIIISGVGAGPINRGFNRKLAVKIFNHAKIINVRDETSRKYMMSYGVKNIINETSDSAQVINNNFFSQKLKHYPVSNIIDEASKNVLVHISEAIDFEFYKEIVLERLARFLPEDVTIIISNDVEGNTDLLRRAKEVFRNFDCRVFDYSNPFEFINLISRVDSIVTPKLHVGIFGATYGKPIISFPLHPEKTLRYYSQIGYPEVSKSLFEVTESDIKIMIDRYLWRPVELSEEILQLADKNFRIFDQITF